MAQKRMLRERL